VQDASLKFLVDISKVEISLKEASNRKVGPGSTAALDFLLGNQISQISESQCLH
jgi:hypothetical protein